MPAAFSIPRLPEKEYKVMIDTIIEYDKKPSLYAPSTSPFWDDAHISKAMLRAHLDEGEEGASRNHAFIKRSAAWIAATLLPAQYPQLLDLGCGPGIYATLFQKAGYTVTGIDLSPRSIAYAQEAAGQEGLPITYRCGSYLELEDRNRFDLATLIYCDYGALPPQDRKRLLQNVRRALHKNGRLLLDVFTPAQYADRPESKTWFGEQNDFWRPGAYLCLQALYRYDAADTFLNQYIIADEAGVDCYRIWETTFTREKLERELADAGFRTVDAYHNVAGEAYRPGGKTLCIIAEKQ
jgi:SAM-dependent methyltransferase